MDFLECPSCGQRFVVRDAGGGDGWACRSCRAELRLVARELPGDRRELAEVLHAQHLEPTNRSLDDWLRQAA
jgi:ribosomal protein L37AE/L43A